jgi:hypothetical protein
MPLDANENEKSAWAEYQAIHKVALTEYKRVKREAYAKYEKKLKGSTNANINR